MKSMMVLLGDDHDPESGLESYRIAIPTQIEDLVSQLYPSPDGTWRRRVTHDIVLSGCKVVRAGDLHGEAPQDVWVWNGYRFRRTSNAVMTSDDLYPEVHYTKKDTVKLLPNGAGPFCEFVVAGLPPASGVYAFFVGGVLRYVGRSQNLKKRFYDYGHISPKKCYQGGQATNILMNKHLREAFRANEEIEIFVHKTLDYIILERTMIAVLQPLWNVQGIKKQQQ